MDIKYEVAGGVTGVEFFDLLDRMENSVNDMIPAHKAFHRSLRTVAKEESSIANAGIITARDSEGLLIGFLRYVTDYTYVYYLTEMMVDPKYQGMGVGKKLMNIWVDEGKKGGFIKMILTSIPDKEQFYRKLDFQPPMSPVLALRGEDFVDEQ